MTNGTNKERVENLLLVALLIIITLFTAWREGYFPLISIFFWLVLIASFLITTWLALSISTTRLLAFVVVVFIIEYVNQTVGTRSNMWIYHGTNSLYIFGVWTWVWVALSVYAVSTKIIIRQIRRLNLSLPRWLNPVILTFIFLLIPLTLGAYWSGARGLFWSFFALLLIVGIYASLKMDLPVFAGIVITAWIASNISEYTGSVLSTVWSFPHNPSYPPFFLLFGAWPLEILAQYALSAFLAGEALDKDTF